MRNSKKILLGAILASATLVGGAAAAFIVTDNADAIGVQVSPGKIQSDGKERIVLNWGENSIQNVEDLPLGGSKRVGTLVLKADKKGSDEFDYTGLLNISIEDLTSKTSGARFADYLDVKIYEGNLEEVTDQVVFGKLSHSDGAKSINIAAKGSSGGKTYTAFVELSNDAVSVYNEILNDQVYLKFNWNKAKGDTDVAEDTETIYMYDPENKLGLNDNELPYVYAYSINEESKLQESQAWPGDKMTKVSSGLYSYELSKSFNLFIFNAGKDRNQTVDIEYNSPADGEFNYYTIGELKDGKYNVNVGTDNPTTLADYYVTGIICEEDKWFTKVGYVEALKMTTVTDGENKAILDGLALKKDDKLKVIDKSGKYYGRPETGSDLISEGVTVGSVDQDGNFVILADGTYIIYLNNDYQIWCALKPETGSGD